MSKLTYKVSYYVLYAMFALIVIVLGLFYFGGQMETPIVYDMDNPANTDALLYLMYGLFGIAVVATVVAAIFQFGSALKDKNFILKFSETTVLYIPFRACPPWRRLGAKTRIQ